MEWQNHLISKKLGFPPKTVVFPVFLLERKAFGFEKWFLPMPEVILHLNEFGFV